MQCLVRVRSGERHLHDALNLIEPYLHFLRFVQIRRARREREPLRTRICHAGHEPGREDVGRANRRIVHDGIPPGPRLILGLAQREELATAWSDVPRDLNPLVNERLALLLQSTPARKNPVSQLAIITHLNSSSSESTARAESAGSARAARPRK